jgi:hypothetical protein
MGIAASATWVVTAGFDAPSDLALLTSAIEQAPIAGRFVTAREDAAVIDVHDFVADREKPGDMDRIPTLRDVLVSGDPSVIPLVGLLVSGEGAGLRMLPARRSSFTGSEILSPDLPVIGWIPIRAESRHVVLASSARPSHAVGLIPVLGPDRHPVAVLVATVSRPRNQAPPTISLLDSVARGLSAI